MSVVSIPGRLYGEPKTNIDPDTGKTSDGKTAFAKFTVGEYNYRMKNVNFFDVVTFGKTAEIALKFFARNRAVVVEGNLDIDKWTTKEGKEVKSIQVIAHRVIYLTDGDMQIEKEEPPVEPAEDDEDDDGVLPF